MPTPALTLVLVAAVAHAVWNLASKRAGGAGAPFVWLSGAGSSILLAPWALVVLVNHPGRALVWIGVGIVSGFIHSAYFVTLQRGYGTGDVSVVYPLARGTGPALSVAFAVLLFHEWPGPLGFVGAGVVIIGVLVIALSTSGRVGRGAGRGSPPLAGVAFGLATGVLIACYTLWDAYAVTDVGVFPVTMMWFSVMTQAICLAPLALRDRPRLRRVFGRHHWEALIVAVLSPTAYILVLFALRQAPVALVAPTREVSVVLVSLGGSLIFHEPALVRRLVGAAIVLGGIVCLALA